MIPVTLTDYLVIKLTKVTREIEIYKNSIVIHAKELNMAAMAHNIKMLDKYREEHVTLSKDAVKHFTAPAIVEFKDLLDLHAVTYDIENGHVRSFSIDEAVLLNKAGFKVKIGYYY